MSLRKTAALLAASGLAVGLLGTGVGAQFTDFVTASQNIQVGTFGCSISSATTGAVLGAADSNGNVHSVSYTAPTIMSSAPGGAPFEFTVKNYGSIPTVLTASATPVTAPFVDILGAPPAVTLPSNASHTYNAGISWGPLDNAWLGAKGTITYTVNCGEGPMVWFTSGPSLAVNNSDWNLPYHMGGSGFDTGVVTITASYAWSDYTFTYSVIADGSGNFSYDNYENCQNNAGTYFHTNQAVNLTATDGVHSATGTGILLCSLR